MSGFIGYVGNKPCKQILHDGLMQLEFQEHDSAGFACIDNAHNHFSFRKEIGGASPITRLFDGVKFDGNVGMGHIRWATRGGVDQRNAHPHFNCNKSIAVIHNGVIEDYEKIRQDLIDKKHDFNSLTDTEVAAHLLNDLLEEYKDLRLTFVELCKQLRGAYALAFIFEQYPDRIYFIRHHSPLFLGHGQNEMFIASDPLCFVKKTHITTFIPDKTFGFITKDTAELYDFNGKSIPCAAQEMGSDYLKQCLPGFQHHILQEIYEQKRSINRTINFCKSMGNFSHGEQEEPHSYQNKTDYNECNDALWRQIGLTKERIKSLSSIHLIGAGTSWHAARIAQFFFEFICNVHTHAHLASEFRYMPFFADPDSLYVALSQSGETSDILEAVRLVNSFEHHTIAITNVTSSTLVREASGFLPMQAGPEISGSSTKAFSSELAILYWLAHCIALETGKITASRMHQAEEELLVAAEILEASIETNKYKIIQEIAPFYARFNHFIFLGRHICYPLAMEAALKLKEVSYIFAQAYPAGELKHGPITIVNQQTPVVIFSILDELIYHKIVANAKEVKARRGHIIAFAFEGQKELIALADTVFVLPPVAPLLAPLVMSGLMQFFIYQISLHLGTPIDKPRSMPIYPTPPEQISL